MGGVAALQDLAAELLAALLEVERTGHVLHEGAAGLHGDPLGYRAPGALGQEAAVRLDEAGLLGVRAGCRDESFTTSGQ
ncbi:hypothetical protein GCM10010359_39940 [Streptomyces morookaense]|nr:hypothetical protein GCM10010359_39940 [Streptomyces morookaense]